VKRRNRPEVRRCGSGELPMAVQRSQSPPGAFRAGVAAAQSGYGGRGRGGSFTVAHSQQHEDVLARMDAHDRRIAALEDLDPTTYDTSAGTVKKPGPQNYGED